MITEERISESKTRLVLLFILATLLHTAEYTFFAWFVTGWSTMGLLVLIINITKYVYGK